MTDRPIEVIFEEHAETVYRVCFTYFKGHAMDAEDAMQSVFLNLLKSGKAFESAQHEKAWLIVTASNVCKNMLKRKSRCLLRLEDHQFDAEATIDETFGRVLALPQKYKLTIYLFYYEGYSAKEIGYMMGKRQSTIWKYLKDGRDILKKEFTEEIV